MVIESFNEYYRPAEALFDACTSGVCSFLVRGRMMQASGTSACECMTLNTMVEEICCC